MATEQVCRIGDQGEGICYNHTEPTAFTTTFYTGSATVTVDGIQVCIVGTLGHTTCGHTTRATTGSGLSTAPEGELHRVGDVGIVIDPAGGNYTATTGSPTTTSL